MIIIKSYGKDVLRDIECGTCGSVLNYCPADMLCSGVEWHIVCPCCGHRVYDKYPTIKPPSDKY